MRRLLKNFIRSEDGNYLMLTVLCSTALFGMVGLGVNTAQLYHTKTNLRQALDAAVTSTARDLTTGRIPEADARDTVQRMLTANSTGGFAVGGVLKLDELNINQTDRTVQATASADVEIAFPLFGIGKTHKVVTEATALYSDRKVEVAMMLDVTGSMGEDGTRKDGRKQTKLQNLQDAASGAVDDLLQRNTNPSDPRLRVALIPYAQGVNTGSSLNSVVFYEARGFSDKPLGLDALNLPENKLIKQAVAAAKAALGDNCATERKSVDNSGNATLDTSDLGPFDSTVNRDDRLGKSGCPSAEIVPLTADAKRLKNAIANFKAAAYTAGHIGIQWTQYMLSPKWGSFLKDATGGKVPAEYKDKGAKKIAILMTDGEFNTAFVTRQDGIDTPASNENSPEYANGLCDQMKGNDIEVFTIGFMLDQEGAKNTLRGCASPDSNGVTHFYDASNGVELKKAFDSITANIEQVRLTN